MNSVTKPNWEMYMISIIHLTPERILDIEDTCKTTSDNNEEVSNIIYLK